jgi:hypothetical protein
MLLVKSWEDSVRSWANLSSHSSNIASAFAAFVIFAGLRTPDMALIPEAKVRGFSDDTNLFQASHPMLMLLLTTALASPVVVFNKTW